MSLSIFQKLGLGETKQMFIILQMVDDTTKKLLEISEDVLVKIEKIYIPDKFHYYRHRDNQQDIHIFRETLPSYWKDFNRCGNESEKS